MPLTADLIAYLNADVSSHTSGKDESAVPGLPSAGQPSWALCQLSSDSNV